jgi:DNA polymerase III sliding clamp (beta) subunit (PCNA family)
MKFTCETAAFSEAISTASRAVNPKTTIEALEALDKEPVSDSLVLLKGSRGIKLEILIDKL